MSMMYVLSNGPEQKAAVLHIFKQLRVPYEFSRVIDRCGVPRILILEGKVGGGGGCIKHFLGGSRGMSN